MTTFKTYNETKLLFDLGICLLHIRSNSQCSLGKWRPNFVPGLLFDPKECPDLEAQADEELGQHREQQRP